MGFHTNLLLHNNVSILLGGKFQNNALKMEDSSFCSNALGHICHSQKDYQICCETLFNSQKEDKTPGWFIDWTQFIVPSDAVW